MNFQKNLTFLQFRFLSQIIVRVEFYDGAGNILMLNRQFKTSFVCEGSLALTKNVWNHLTKNKPNLTLSLSLVVHVHFCETITMEA